MFHSGVCAATLTFSPGYGDDSAGAHDVTVWDTQFGSAADTWIYYQTDQPLVFPTPAPTPTATPTPTPHPSPSPTAPPAPSPPSGGQASGGSGGTGGTGSDGGFGPADSAGASGGGGTHASTPAATTTPAPLGGASLWLLLTGAVSLGAAGGGVLAWRHGARQSRQGRAAAESVLG